MNDALFSSVQQKTAAFIYTADLVLRRLLTWDGMLSNIQRMRSSRIRTAIISIAKIHPPKVTHEVLDVNFTRGVSGTRIT